MAAGGRIALVMGEIGRTDGKEGERVEGGGRRREDVQKVEEETGGPEEDLKNKGGN
jgi:hypothetical protein